MSDREIRMMKREQKRTNDELRSLKKMIEKKNREIERERSIVLYQRALIARGIERLSIRNRESSQLQTRITQMIEVLGEMNESTTELREILDESLLIINR